MNHGQANWLDILVAVIAVCHVLRLFGVHR